MVIQDQTKNFGKSLTSFKTIVDWCDSFGFKLFETVIYRKYGAEGAWWNKRFRVDHEYVPIFLKGERPQYFNKEHLKIPSKHGGKTIFLARFIPIVRTFAPFVAGVGKMHYPTFLLFNITGGFLWVTSLTFAGYFFGGLSIIKNNFEYAVFGIIFASLIPVFIEFAKNKRASLKKA